MATPPELIKAVSEATGLSVPTIFELDRQLVKANLRPVGGRGPNAAKMGPLEAARLLTAALASPQSNKAAEAVLRYAATRPDKGRSSEGLFGAIGLDDLGALTARHSFVEGLTALITSVANGSIADLVAGSSRPHIEVFAFTQATHGRIRISGLPNGITASVEYMPSEPAPARKAKAAKSNISESTGDLEQSRRITDRTIFAVAELFA